MAGVIAQTYQKNHMSSQSFCLGVQNSKLPPNSTSRQYADRQLIKKILFTLEEIGRQIVPMKMTHQVLEQRKVRFCGTIDRTVFLRALVLEVA